MTMPLDSNGHRAQEAVQIAELCGFEILPHPAYSPHLVPSDFFLFPNPKKFTQRTGWYVES